MQRPLLIIFLIMISSIYTAHANGSYPAEVEAVLKKAGSNRVELEKAIIHFKKENDTEKLKAVYFLIGNMDIHYSSDYYWVDQQGKKVDYNELAYPDFGKAVSAFESIKKKTPGIHPKVVYFPDIKFMKADYLINNIENAFKMWRSGSAKNIPFADFCEYILPYRASVEPLQNWRIPYQSKFGWITDMVKRKGLAETLGYVASDERSWFMDTWGKEVRTEPLPRLGAMQLLLRKKGPCEDIADLEIFSLRSQGIPIALDIVPYWATSTDGHFLNTVFDRQMKPINYDVMKTPALGNGLGREPSKVIRETYSKQLNVLASFEDTAKIPDGVMRKRNYIDVTSSYWQTTNIKCSLFDAEDHSKIVYACIFNGLQWRAAWWGKVKNNVVSFTNMSKGVVYLPAYYENGKLKAAGYPVAEGYAHELVLKPDLANRAPVVIAEEDKYLFFQSGKKYRLFYWDNQWRLAGIKTPMPFEKTILFNNVPKNALLLLVPDYTIGKERPFIMTDEGKRVWL